MHIIIHLFCSFSSNYVVVIQKSDRLPFDCAMPRSFHGFLNLLYDSPVTTIIVTKITKPRLAMRTFFVQAKKEKRQKEQEVILSHLQLKHDVYFAAF